MKAEPPASAALPGLYIHFPFCASRCCYCDFESLAGRDDLIGSYLDALQSELERGQPELPLDIDSVFVGGGTPSRMTSGQLAALLDAVARRYRLAQDCEISVECNPESLSKAKLVGYKAAGVSRISIGLQSLDDSVLQQVGRAHDARSGLRAVAAAQAHGRFEVNVDLIAGLPGEDLERWESTVKRVARLGTEHVSVYLLETDKDTPLSRSVIAGKTHVADDDALASAYHITQEVFESLGLKLYEICNFARAERYCRHNLKYWTDCWYGGFGLGAHAYAAGCRRANTADLDTYLGAIRAGRDPLENGEEWDAQRRLEEALICGLRLAAGLDVEELGRRYGVDLGRLYRQVWDSAISSALLEWDGPRLRLTRRGRLLSNSLFRDIIDHGDDGGQE